MKTQKIIAPAIHPKYRIGELLRATYGELNMKTGIDQLAAHCKLRNKRTVTDWIKIEAGNQEEIHHHLIEKVLAFFCMQEESQLFTKHHTELLKKRKKTA